MNVLNYRLSIFQLLPIIFFNSRVCLLMKTEFYVSGFFNRNRKISTATHYYKRTRLVECGSNLFGRSY